MEVKVLSWNIWLGQHLPDILARLTEEKPAVIGLQEVSSRSDGNLAREIGEILGYRWAYYPSVTSQDGTGKGNAVLSTYPILSATSYFLSPAVNYDGTPTTEPRTALCVDLSVDGLSLTVISTHLAYAPWFASNDPQAAQVKTLVQLVRDRCALVLMGDLNSLPTSDTVRALSSVLTPADPAPSTPTWTMYPHEYLNHSETRLKDRIDYMFTSGDIKVKHFEVGMSKGSNHLPISAVLEL